MIELLALGVVELQVVQPNLITVRLLQPILLNLIAETTDKLKKLTLKTIFDVFCTDNKFLFIFSYICRLKNVNKTVMINSTNHKFY